MSASLHQIRVPLLIRVALTELAERRQQSEDEVLESLIRDAVRRELLGEEPEPEREATPCPR
ncbi:MAG: hypothetical protein HPY83_08840 [Anaerolineae bacterium]|nr:hypothetical protein [Anaerolineae bacterium]